LTFWLEDSGIIILGYILPIDIDFEITYPVTLTSILCIAAAAPDEEERGSLIWSPALNMRTLPMLEHSP